MLRKYKDIFGKPGEGFHSVRFLGMALYDVIGMIVIGLFIVAYFKVSIFKTFITLTIFTVLIHRLFCVNTTLNVLIFGTII